MKHILKSLFSFLRNPKDEKDHNASFSSKVKVFGLLFCFEVLVMILLAGLINFLDSSGLVDLSEHELGNMMEELPIILMLLMGVVCVPFLEELIFRLFLKYERNLPAQLLGKVIGEEKMLGFWHKNYRFIFYFSALAFGYAHIFNFGTLSTTILLFSPILILPQFFMGSVAGYLRVKFGFMWSYALHFFHNLLFIGGAFLAMNVAVEKVDISNEKYDIKIEEIALSNIKEKSITTSFSDTSDSLETEIIENYNTNDLMLYLLDNTASNMDIQHQGIKNFKFNIEFEAKEAGIDKRAAILNEFKEAYDIAIDTENREEKEWEMVLRDSSLLFKYLHDENYESFGIKGNPFKGKNEYSNFSIDKIANSLQRHYKKSIISHIEVDQKFDMTLTINDFSTLKDELKNKYGIEFLTSGKNITYTIIKKAEE